MNASSWRERRGLTESNVCAADLGKYMVTMRMRGERENAQRVGSPNIFGPKDGGHPYLCKEIVVRIPQKEKS